MHATTFQMPHLCSKSSSRLSTSAVFIFVGVVQLIVGIILLKSNFVYLLAGPDFWTSISNIAVGCLLGVSACVWSQSKKKRQLKKQIIRRNFLLALLFSALIMNATTLIILLLGESNTLLSIRLESKGKYSEMTFESEILAYAYVISVCCPVVCTVVSIVSISGDCFIVAGGNSKGRKHSLKGLKNQTRTLQWVYTPDHVRSYKNKASDFNLSAESSSDDDLYIPVRQKQASSIEELQSVLSRMAEGKRDSILSDSAIMLRQLDERRKKRNRSTNPKESYIGPINHRKEHSFDYSDSNDSEIESLRLSEVRGARLPPEDISLKYLNSLKDKRLNKLHKSVYTKESKKHKDTPQLPTRYSVLQCGNREEKDADKTVLDNMLDKASSADYFAGKNSSVTFEKSRKTSTFEPLKTQDFKYNHQEKGSYSITDNPDIILENKVKKSYERSKPLKRSSALNDFSTDTSEFSPDSPFEFSRSSSWAGETVAINVKTTPVVRLSEKLIPVASPVVPNIQELKVPKHIDDSGIGSIKSNIISPVSSNQIVVVEENMLLSRESPKEENKQNIQEYPKAGSSGIKRYDLNRIPAMASISEEPNLELTQLHGSSFREKTPRLSKEYIRRQSLPPSSKGSTLQDEDNPKRYDTPKRKISASGKVLRRIWSVSSSDNQTQFLDQVVDDDSLIGLSEDELIARQFRNRSIRKVIQQRIKEEMVL